MSANQKLFDSVASTYATKELHEAERKLLAHFKGRWHTLNMLDLGVGAGRTSYTLAPLCKNYLGLDYSESMIRLCKEQIGESPGVKFEVADATNLSFLKDQKFDFILFSYNGMDYVGEADRLKILSEVRARLEPGGLFVFSSHCLWCLPFRLQLPRRPWLWPQALFDHLRLLWSNRGISIADGRAILQDGAHHFGLGTYYTTPGFQISQLKESGFDEVEVRDRFGNPLQAERLRHPWLYYFCR